jgi:hypothetical protein
VDNPSTSPQEPRCPPDQGCANPRTALPEPPRHPRLIPVRTGLVRSIALESLWLSTSPVHLSTSLGLVVTLRHDLCLKHTRRSAETRVVPDGDRAATRRHGVWITVDNLSGATTPIDYRAIFAWRSCDEVGRRANRRHALAPSVGVVRAVSDEAEQVLSVT